MTSYRGLPLLHLPIKLHAAILALIMTAANLALAAPLDAPGNVSFLALGDSIAFGSITQDGYAYVNARNFVAYPDYVGDDLRLDTTNAACPGETSSSFLSSIAFDPGCRAYKQLFPLHVAYASTQFDFAMDFLATHKQAKLVTVALGANDLIVLQTVCAGNIACIQAGLPAALATIGSNLNFILNSLRATGFRGVLMVVNYYSLDYSDPLLTGFTVLLNQTLATAAAANGAVVADVFKAFQRAASTSFAAGATCKTGLLNGNPQNQSLCDDHPSQSGHQLMSETIEATYRAALAGS